MSVSRRQFTKEFKLAAVRRLEQGVSMAEAARALEATGVPPGAWKRVSGQWKGALVGGPDRGIGT